MIMDGIGQRPDQVPHSQQDSTQTSYDRITQHRKMTCLGGTHEKVIHRSHLNDPNAEGPARNERTVSQRGLIQFQFTKTESRSVGQVRGRWIWDKCGGGGVEGLRVERAIGI